MITELQNQLDDTIQITRSNLSKKLHERHLKLVDLEQRTELLEQFSNQFKTASRTLKRQFWWAQSRTKVILASIGVGTLIAGSALILL